MSKFLSKIPIKNPKIINIILLYQKNQLNLIKTKYKI